VRYPPPSLPSPVLDVVNQQFGSRPEQGTHEKDPTHYPLHGAVHKKAVITFCPMTAALDCTRSPVRVPAFSNSPCPSPLSSQPNHRITATAKTQPFMELSGPSQMRILSPTLKPLTGMGRSPPSFR